MKKTSLITIFAFGLLCLNGCQPSTTALTSNQSDTANNLSKIITEEQSTQSQATGATLISQTSETTEPARNFHDEVPVLMFHYVRTVDRSKDPLGYNLSVTPEYFEKILQYLSENKYHTIQVADLEKEPIPSKSIILTFDDGHEDFYTTAIPLLKKYGFTASNAVIYNFMGRPDFMTADEVKQISEDGFEILSHSMNHTDMTKTNNPEYEIMESKTDLEKLIGKAVIAFVYPSGRFNDQTQALVKKAGYRFAFTTQPGDANLDKDPYTLQRIRVDNRVLLATLAKELGN